jgi:hypothetical protein
MIRMIEYAFVIFFLICSFSLCQSASVINIYDGFETPDISENWSKDRFMSKSVAIQSDVFREGKSAVRITLREGDQLEDEKGTELERAELMESREFVSKEDCSYSYSFSMFLPEEFPIVQTRLVIAQWKQYCGNEEKCGGNSPVIAVRYIGGEMIINIMKGSEKTVLFSTTEEMRNKWLDFKFKIHFPGIEKGRIEAWLNEKQIVSYNGDIGYTEKEGYPPQSYYYFKMGLYRDTMPEPMTIYIDEYRKKQLTDF